MADLNLVSPKVISGNKQFIPKARPVPPYNTKVISGNESQIITIQKRLRALPPAFVLASVTAILVLVYLITHSRDSDDDSRR